MKRLLSVVLVVSLVLSLLVVPSGAAFGTPDDVLYNQDAVTAWESRFDAWYLELDPTDFIQTSWVAFCWRGMNNAVSASGFGRVRSLSVLNNAAASFNSVIRDFWKGSMISAVTNGFKYPEAIVQFDSNLNAYVLVDKTSGIHMVSSDGRYPYYEPTKTDPTTGTTTPDPDLGGKWILKSRVNWTKVNVLSEYNLYSLGSALKNTVPDNDIGEYDKKYFYLGGKWDQDSSGDHFVYCDGSGKPYVARMDESQWSQNNTNNYYTEVTEEGDTIYNNGDTIETQVIDNSTNTVVLPNGDINFIENLVYDESTKTYYVDAHQEYDITNNTYVTNNYHIEYHINYTSVTYIGATEEYTETYDYYYQLPDGRSSADLTAEELQVLNTQIDVLPYNRSADDTSIRALYHFDGDCLDSSYWSHLGFLSWTTGASITYMDANKFNGALYLDENAHDFTISLPSTLASGDFTVQWRYYQSHTLTPSSDSSFSIGKTVLLRFDGSSILNADSEVLSPVSVGNWQEIAVVRKDGVITYFHNGVPIGSTTDNSPMDKTLRFLFGATQQTFKYFDELRVVSAALYDAEKGYAPSSVPHDTNLALVLPDELLPVADEYWSITSSGDNLLSDYGLDWLSSFTTDNSYVVGEDNVGATGQFNLTFTPHNFPYFGYNETLTTFFVDNGLSMTSNYYETGTAFSKKPVDLFISDSSYGYPSYGLWSQVYSYKKPSGESAVTSNPLETGNYVLSIVTDDGVVTSLPFYRDSSSKSDVIVEGSGYRLAFYYTEYKSSSTTYRRQYLAVQPLEYDKPTPRIVYMELVKGTETDLSAEFVSSIVVMKKEDLNTPSLAVRTDTTITGYQIGGVRPSLPSKGLVWALVESGRITSLQIYNGQAWVAVDGRIWTGSRWVPYYAYDVLLLKDLWDIAESDPTLDPIYTETGFWTWLQTAWSGMLARLDAILSALGGSDNPGDSSDAPSGLPGVTCTHAYVLDSEVPASCAAPGQRNFECPVCGAQYIEVVSAFGHDWVAEETKPDTYSLPEDTVCPDCASTEFAAVLDEADAQYSCTCNSCSKEWVQNALLVKGETTYKCTICELTYVGTEHPDSVEDEDSWTLFDLVGIVKDGVWKIIKGAVSTAVGGLSDLVSGVSNIGGFFDAYDSDTPGGVLDMLNQGGPSVWD